MGRSSLALLALSTVLLLATGCPSSSTKDGGDAGADSGPIGPDPLPGDALCAEFADEFCRANETCCGRPDEVYASFTACAREQRLLCQGEAAGFEYPMAIADEDILYNQGRVGAALERVTEAVIACSPIDFEEEILNGITGTVGVGGACIRVSCADGLACIGGTCVTQPEMGATCTVADGCGALRCRMDGTCQPFGGASDACDVDEDCVSRFCVSGSCEAVSADTAYCVRLGSPERPFAR